MDRQLAERMVGAACLLAVLVLVVPAILDGNPDSGATITHPQVDESLDLRTHTIRLDGDEREPPVPTPVQAGTGPAPRVGEQPDAGKESPGAAATQLPAPDALPDERPGVPKGPESGAVPEAAAPSAKAPPAPVAAADPPSASAAQADVAGSGDWFVQLGSFSRRDNAERLAADLKRKGFPSIVQGGGGSSGSLFRVRAGPAADKAGAEALATRLAAAGFAGGRVGRK